MNSTPALLVQISAFSWNALELRQGFGPSIQGWLWAIWTHKLILETRVSEEYGYEDIPCVYSSLLNGFFLSEFLNPFSKSKESPSETLAAVSSSFMLEVQVCAADMQLWVQIPTQGIHTMLLSCLKSICQRTSHVLNRNQNTGLLNTVIHASCQSTDKIRQELSWL